MMEGPGRRCPGLDPGTVDGGSVACAVGPMTRLELRLYMERIRACGVRLREALQRLDGLGNHLELSLDVHRNVHAVLFEHFARPFAASLRDEEEEEI